MEYVNEREDWDDMDPEKKLNVYLTFITDLENEVGWLEQRVSELEEYL